MIARISQSLHTQWTHLIDLPLDDFETTPPEVILAHITQSLQGARIELGNPEALCAIIAHPQNGPLRVQLLHFDEETATYSPYESA